MTSTTELNWSGRLVVWTIVGAAIGFGALGLATPIEAQSQATPLSYTAAQAEQGQLAYVEHCASCHGQNLDDGAYGPPLTGAAFRQDWGSGSAERLFTSISTKMPPARPGTLGDATYAQLLAFMLQENGSRAGTRELPADPDALKAMAAPNWPASGGGGLASRVVLPPAPPRINPLDKIRPVTEAMLNKVPDGEWLTWRRTYDAFGFSPLKRITKTNINDLRVAWTWSLPNGPNESTPIVHDGVLFIHSYGDKVQALDAATGDLLWQYSRRLPTGVPQHQAGHLDLRHSPLRADLGRAHRRARCEDRKSRVGPGRRRPDERLPDHRRPARGSRQGDDRHDGSRRGR